MTTQILIPINHSAYSQAILPHVEKLFAPQDAILRLFFVTRPSRGIGFAAPALGPDYASGSDDESTAPKVHPIYAEQQEESIQAHIEAELLPLMNRLQTAGYETSLRICFNEHVVDEIVRLALRDEMDLIAMSTRARDRVRGFFFTDVANLVMRKAHIPVLLFHPTI